MQSFSEEQSRGRRYPFDEEKIYSKLNPFLVDYMKIIQSKAFRRLAYKTQVFCFPENPHVRTRATHTQEVIALSLVISENLGLNTYLCQAIAAGHDIGHVPYGHLGERFLSEISGKKFSHAVFGSVVAQNIERKGKGLNLSYETLEGIVNHQRGKNELVTEKSKPPEYAVVMFADKIAYTFSDVNDAIRYGYLDRKKISNLLNGLGSNQRERINSCLESLLKESKEKDSVSFSEGKIFQKFDELKSFMYENVYEKINTRLHETILRETYEFFSGLDETKKIQPEIILSLLTDIEINEFANYIIKTKKPKADLMNNFGAFEIFPYIKNRKIDFTNPDLDWNSQLL